ncbi:zinc finger protein 462-like [Grus japonensis]|uniref:Zinc finger protein 462-like n=1 Tax=Grus japonensis TaxID=30415 RepID=A0ABC9YH34_GRUJA
MPAGSKTDLPLAKAKPISASVITYLRREKNSERELLQLEKGVRRCKKLCRHQVNEGSDRVALMGTWPPARINPPQCTTCFADDYTFEEEPKD